MLCILNKTVLWFYTIVLEYVRFLASFFLYMCIVLSYFIFYGLLSEKTWMMKMMMMMMMMMMMTTITIKHTEHTK